MKIWMLLAAALGMSSLGCRSYYYAHTDAWGGRSEIWINSFASDSQLGALEIQAPDGRVLRIEGYSQKSNEQIAGAVAEGVTRGLMKGAMP